MGEHLLYLIDESRQFSAGCGPSVVTVSRKARNSENFFFGRISRYVNLWALFGQTEHQIVISLLGASQFSPEDHFSASMIPFRLAMRP